MRSLFYLSVMTLVMSLNSCANSYKAIHPESLKYGATSTEDGIVVQYRYDALGVRGNRKYSKKEDKANVAVVALKINNTTNETIKIGENAKLYLGDAEIIPFDPDQAVRLIKQKAGLYWLYLLMTPMNVYVEKDGERDNFPVGLILGPGLAIGNSAVAGSANKKLKSDLARYNIHNKEIKPGETIHAVVTVPSRTFSPLSIRLAD